MDNYYVEYWSLPCEDSVRFNFVDQKSVALPQLILTIRAFLELKSPKEFYIPFPVAHFGVGVLQKIIKILIKLGIEARMPPELMFLENFYQTQTLSSEKLERSSFTDPSPSETVFTQLPDIIEYYLTRWRHLNLISSYDEEFFDPQKIAEDFLNCPETLLEEIHQQKRQPFKDFKVEQNNDRNTDVASLPY